MDAYDFKPPEGDISSYVVATPYSHSDIATPEALQDMRRAARIDPGDNSTLHLRTDFASRARITPLSTSGGLGLLPAEVGGHAHVAHAIGMRVSDDVAAEHADRAVHTPAHAHASCGRGWSAAAHAR